MAAPFSRLQATPLSWPLYFLPRVPVHSSSLLAQETGSGHRPHRGWGSSSCRTSKPPREVGTGPCAGLLWGSLSTSSFCWNLGGSEVRERKHPAVESSKVRSGGRMYYGSANNHPSHSWMGMCFPCAHSGFTHMTCCGPWTITGCEVSDLRGDPLGMPSAIVRRPMCCCSCGMDPLMTDMRGRPDPEPAANPQPSSRK